MSSDVLRVDLPLLQKQLGVLDETVDAMGRFTKKAGKHLLKQNLKRLKENAELMDGVCNMLSDLIGRLEKGVQITLISGKPEKRRRK